MNMNRCILAASDELAFSKGPSRSTLANAIRISEGNQWAQFSCFRATAAGLEHKDFLYASDNPNGVLGGGCGGSEITGSVDEIRCVHAFISLDELSRFIPDGLTVIFR